MVDTLIEPWRRVLRHGFLKVLPREGVAYVLEMLKNDDKRLIQGSTTSPETLMCMMDWDCEGGCFVSSCGFGTGARTVQDFSELFANACFDADQSLGETAACRHFLNWFDETPRDEMRRELIEELEIFMNDE